MKVPLLKLSMCMKIASLYPLIRGYAEADWDFIRALLCSSRKINNFHVFLPLDCQPPKSFPNISGVSIHSVIELAEFFQENSIDVWHDFGYSDVSHLTHLRGLSGQIFPITIQVQPWRLALDPLKISKGLTEYDALLCSKPSICRIVHQSAQSFPSSNFIPEIFTIPSGVNTSTEIISDKQDARYLLDLPGQDLIILCLTDFSVYEGGDLFPLFHAFQVVAEKHGDVRLIISGFDEYGYADKFQNFLDNSHLGRQIILMPNASKSAQSLLLSAADIFISPSDTIHRDNQIQVLRAMGNNLPVIVTDDDDGGVIAHGKNGLKLRRICQPSSYDALNNYMPLVSEDVKPLILSQGIVVDTQQIIEFLTLLIEDRELRQTLGKTARHYVVANHGWETMVNRYISLWQTLRERVPSDLQHTKSSEIQGDILFRDANTRDFSFFSFMSADLEEDTSLQLTSVGETLLETQHLISYDVMKDIIYPPVVFKILNLARAVTTGAEIINSLLLLTDGDDTDNLVPNITYHIMWCVKQGFISLSKNGQSL